MRNPIKYMLTGLLAVAGVAVAQAPAVEPPSGQKSLAATLNVYAFPNAGQAPAQQSKDEGDCYNWAVQNTGTDPFQSAKQAEQAQQQAAQQQQQAQQAAKGSGAKGAVGGAAVGAIIGEIASDDAGKGAAWGAGIGMVGNRARAKRQEEKSVEQAQQQEQAAVQASAAQVDNFKKAFSVCLESKKYMVKY